MRIVKRLAPLLAVCAAVGTANAQATPVYIASQIPYSADAPVKDNVKAECPLPEQQADLLEKAARAQGILVVRDDAAVTAGKGRVLVIEITNVLSAGGAFIGHNKSMTLHGRLLLDGTEIGSFVGVRSSGGGAFGGYKSSCSVLGRCLKTLADDITNWLRAPGKNSRIGE